jgi:TRAP-type C4-dicarboxylate transport system permease small subunit
MTARSFSFMTTDRWTNLARSAARLAEWTVSAMFACVFLVFVYKIVMRYAAGNAVAWADEISVILFIWIIFCANAFLVSDRRQITFDLVYRWLSPQARRVSRIARLIVVGGLFLWSLPAVIDYTLFLWREHTPVLSLRLDVVYSCFALFVVAIIVRSVVELIQLIGPNWQQRV